MATLQEMMTKVESCSFECEAGPLTKSRDWIELRARIAVLEAELARIAAEVGHNEFCSYPVETAVRYKIVELAAAREVLLEIRQWRRSAVGLESQPKTDVETLGARIDAALGKGAG